MESFVDGKMTRIVSMTGRWEPFETAVGMILGQMVSVKQAQRLMQALINFYGEKVLFKGRKIKLFPTPEKIAHCDLVLLGTTGRRKETLRAFAKAGEIIWNKFNTP